MTTIPGRRQAAPSTSGASMPGALSVPCPACWLPGAELSGGKPARPGPRPRRPYPRGGAPDWRRCCWRDAAPPPGPPRPAAARDRRTPAPSGTPRVGALPGISLTCMPMSGRQRLGYLAQIKAVAPHLGRGACRALLELTTGQRLGCSAVLVRRWAPAFLGRLQVRRPSGQVGNGRARGWRCHDHDNHRQHGHQ